MLSLALYRISSKCFGGPLGSIGPRATQAFEILLRGVADHRGGGSAVGDEAGEVRTELARAPCELSGKPAARGGPRSHRGHPLVS